MLEPRQIEEIAAEMRSAQLQVRQIAPFSSRWPGFDLPSAYAVAARIRAARIAQGELPVGRKIGFTNSDLWPIYGVRQPIWGDMYGSTVRRLADTGGRCAIAGFAEPQIEPEIVFHFSAAPAGSALPDLLAAIDWVAHGFEIVQSHFPDWKFEAPDTVADGGLHAALLLGEPQPLGRLGPDPAAALESFSLALSCDGEVRDRGRGAHVLGNPLAALQHLIRVLASQPDQPPLRAGEIVTTGTVTKAFPVRAGQRWRTELAGIALPGLDLAFED